MRDDLVAISKCQPYFRPLIFPVMLFQRSDDLLRRQLGTWWLRAIHSLTFVSRCCRMAGGLTPDRLDVLTGLERDLQSSSKHVAAPRLLIVSTSQTQNSCRTTRVTWDFSWSLSQGREEVAREIWST